MAAESLRSIDDAVNGADISDDELRQIADHDGSLRVWCKTAQAVRVLSGWTQPRRIMAHGLSSSALVHMETPFVQRYALAQRVHICRARKCGYRYDNRVAPYLAHQRLPHQRLPRQRLSRGWRERPHLRRSPQRLPHRRLPQQRLLRGDGRRGRACAGACGDSGDCSGASGSLASLWKLWSLWSL